MASAKPPFTLESATLKVKAAQNLWNTQFVRSFPVILDPPNKSQGIQLRFPSRILQIVFGAIGLRFSLARKPYRRFLRPSGKERNLTVYARNYSLLLRIASPCNSGMNTKMPKTVISGNAATDWKIGLSIKMAKWKKG